VERNIVPSAVRFSVTDRVLKIDANFVGHKTVNLFDVNGTLLMRESFSGKYCEIHMDALRGKSFVIASLVSDGQLMKSKKIRVK
jgi:hypothetical protein